MTFFTLCNSSFVLSFLTLRKVFLYIYLAHFTFCTNVIIPSWIHICFSCILLLQLHASLNFSSTYAWLHYLSVLCFSNLLLRSHFALSLVVYLHFLFVFLAT